MNRFTLVIIALIAMAVILQTLIRPSIVNPGRVRLQRPIEATASVSATGPPSAPASNSADLSR